MFLCPRELYLCCGQPHPRYNPTDTCCEICRLCAEQQKSAWTKSVGFLRSLELSELQASVSTADSLSTYSRVLLEMTIVQRSGAGRRRFPLPLFTQAQYGAHVSHYADPVPPLTGRLGEHLFRAQDKGTVGGF